MRKTRKRGYKRRTYPDEFKQNVVNYFLETKETDEEIGKIFNVPKSTVGMWITHYLNQHFKPKTL